MMQDTANVKGLRDLGMVLEQLPQNMQKNAMRGTLRAGAKPILAMILQNVWRDSGQLADGIKIVTGTHGTRVTATIRATGPHAFLAPWLEFKGVKPHTIKAKNGNELEFAGHFAHAVEHPGLKPRPVFRPALEQQAETATLASGQYLKDRLATKYGLETADIEVEAA